MKTCNRYLKKNIQKNIHLVFKNILKKMETSGDHTKKGNPGIELNCYGWSGFIKRDP